MPLIRSGKRTLNKAFIERNGKNFLTSPTSSSHFYDFKVSLERRSIVYVLNLLVAVFLLMLDLDSYFIPEPRGEKLDFKISHPGLFRHAAPSQQDLAL
ncbi:UNVERIFIED_CONTAM: hypothetical protein FKN15_061551 [Acipenser sinensis]